MTEPTESTTRAAAAAPETWDELLTWLGSMPALSRARLLGELVDGEHVAQLAELRHDAVTEASDGHGQAAVVAEELGVTVHAIYQARKKAKGRDVEQRGRTWPGGKPVTTWPGGFVQRQRVYCPRVDRWGTVAEHRLIRSLMVSPTGVPVTFDNAKELSDVPPAELSDTGPRTYVRTELRFVTPDGTVETTVDVSVIGNPGGEVPDNIADDPNVRRNIAMEVGHWAAELDPEDDDN